MTEFGPIRGPFEDGFPRRAKGGSILIRRLRAWVPEAVFSVTLRKRMSTGENKSHVEVRRDRGRGPYGGEAQFSHREPGYLCGCPRSLPVKPPLMKLVCTGLLPLAGTRTD